MRAVKLPSGSWRCQAYRNGIRKSFVVKDPTLAGKRRCEQLAAAWAASQATGGVPIGKAIERYISSKEAVISPSTKRVYNSLKDHAYDGLDGTIDLIGEEALQKWVNAYSKKHSPKSVRNAFALLTSTMKMFGVPVPQVTLPARKPPELGTPTDADVQTLLKATKGTELEKAILLAAFGTLRRGEICGLKKSDIKGNTITVRRSVVYGDGWIEKAPKTVQSIRTIELPAEVISILKEGDSERVCALDPDDISYYFSKVLKKEKLPHFRFHDLRAYAASIRHALGIPDVYIMADGGWKTDTVLKQIYRRQMDDKRAEFSKVSNTHFSSIFEGVAHEISHDG